MCRCAHSGGEFQQCAPQIIFLSSLSALIALDKVWVFLFFLLISFLFCDRKNSLHLKASLSGSINHIGFLAV